MELDPSIILASTRAPQFDPIEAGQKALALRQAQMQVQNQQRLRDLASTSDLSTPEGQAAFVKGYGQIDPASALQLSKTMAQASEQSALTKKNSEMADLQNWKLQHDRHAQIAEDNFSVLSAAKQQVDALPPGDPRRGQIAQSAYNQTVQNSVQGGNPPPPAGDMGPDPEAWLQNKYLQAQPLALAIARQKAALNPVAPLTEVGKINADEKAGRISASDAAAARRKASYIAPSMASIVISQQRDAGAFDPTQPLSPAEEAAARGIADGGQMQPVGTRNPRGQFVNARAQELYSEANGGDMTGFGTLHGTLSKGRGSFGPGGVNGQNLIALDTAVHHFDALGRTIDALNNGDVRALNAAGNYLSTQFGDPKVTNFETVKSLAADEFAKVAAGTATGEQERAKMQQLFSSANSPAQLKQAIDQAKILMAGKVQGMNQQYMQINHGQSIANRVSPQTRQILSGMGLDITGKPPTITNQSDYDKLPNGASYVDANGTPHVKGGGK